MTLTTPTDHAGAYEWAAVWAGTVNLTNPAYAAELAALENYAMSEFITP